MYLAGQMMTYVSMYVCREGVTRQNEKWWVGLPGLIKKKRISSLVVAFLSVLLKVSEKGLGESDLNIDIKLCCPT